MPGAADKPGAERNGRFRLYLSASVANASVNLKLREHLPADRFEVVLPQEFAPTGLSHPRFPAEVYDRCIEEMERCDAGVLLLDAFGIDSASEAGWFAARGKPLVGVAAANTRFLRHWMVKGSLTGVACLDPAVLEAVRADPILRRVPARLAGSWRELPGALEALLGTPATAT